MNPAKIQVFDEDQKKLVLRFLQKHPQAAARIIEQWSSEQVADFLQTMDAAQTLQVTSVMLPYYVARLCQLVPSELAAKWLEALSTRRQTMILRYLSKPQRHAVLEALPTRAAIACRVFLSYPEDTVGAWMSDRYMVLPDNINVDEALQRLQGPNAPFDNDAIPIVNAEHHLSGTVSYNALVSSARSLSITDIMQRDLLTVSARALLVTAQTHEGWRQYDTLPVLNRDRQLVGMLRHVHLRDGIDSLTDTLSHQPIEINNPISSLAQAYVAVLSTSFGWIGELMGREVESRLIQKTRGKS